MYPPTLLAYKFENTAEENGNVFDHPIGNDTSYKENK